MKPTKAALIEQTCRGGRVFLFEYAHKDPNDLVKGSHMPTYGSQQKIEDALLDLPEVKEIGGPYINGIIAITVDDTEEASASKSDDEWKAQIAGVFHRYWRERSA